jgi:tetratricopeptide (TPR) repeat protein
MADDLLAARELHAAGRLEEAKRLYEQILSREPQHAEALHLLGLVALQQGAAQQGVELINRAIARQPGAAHYHVNLAEGYLMLGDLDRATGCCRAALRLQADCVDAVHTLGRILRSRGRKEEAVAAFRRAVRLRPQFAMAHNSLADLLRELGDAAGALDHFRQACAAGPERGDFHSNLGQFLLERGEAEEALEHCRQAVRLLPTLAEAHSNLGNVLRALGQLTEAKTCYLEALRINPNLAMVHSNMGQALQEEGRLDEAVVWYGRALRMEPGSARFHTNLASALAEQENFEEALVSYERALQHDPSYFEAHNGLGALLHDQERHAAAQEHYRAALRLKPDLASSHCCLGEIASVLGDRQTAEASFREALRLDPRCPAVYILLATLLRGQLPEADRLMMEQLLQDPKVRPLDRAGLLHGLAQVSDATGDYARAAACLVEAKGIQQAEWTRRRQLYDAADHQQFVDRVLAAYTPEHFARVRGFGLDSQRPVFIFGLPRSGTTLVEQVLASHSQVFGAGELRLAQQSFQALPGIVGLEAAPLDCLGRLQVGHVRRLAQSHLDRLAELNRSAPRITDKMPDNYIHLGLLATLFPQGRFIHCRRDLRDIAVSCWMTSFKWLRWNAAPETMAARFHDYQRLMAHWRQVLPVPMLEVNYEETVDDLEKTARRLVDWCGLEWEAQCLAFHEHRRPVRTASVNQVRRPVYKTSVARWQHYQAALGPLFDKLNLG